MIQVPNKKSSKTLDEIGRHFLMNTSIFGLSRMIKNKLLIIKIVWVVFTILSFGAGVYFISNTMTNYFSFEPVTNVLRVNPSNVTFPASTICTKGFVRDSITYNDTTSYFIDFDYSISDYAKDIIFKEVRLRDYRYDLEYFKIPKLYGECLRFRSNKNIT